MQLVSVLQVPLVPKVRLVRQVVRPALLVPKVRLGLPVPKARQVP